MNSEMYSNFPTEIDVFPIKTDLMYEQLPDARRYQELKSKSYLTESEQVELSNLTVKLKNSIWFCEDLNAISGGLTKLERYFRDNTISQLNAYKQELADFAADYEKLTYLMYQSWITTTSKDYNIHAGNETLDPIAELTVDASANIELTLDGVGVPYNKYTIVTNTSQKKTIIRFNSDFAITAGKRLEAKWQDTSGKVYSVSGHTHPVSQVTGLATIATSGKYSDLSGIPSSFTPIVHRHSWSQLDGIPTTFSPASHTHDDRYYTESEMNTKLAGKSDSGHKHAIADINGLQGEIDGLKSSVVSGKQVVVNAINDKYGYSSGLTPNNTFNDYAWWIGQIPTMSVNNKIQAIEASLLSFYYNTSKNGYGTDNMVNRWLLTYHDLGSQYNVVFNGASYKYVVVQSVPYGSHTPSGATLIGTAQSVNTTTAKLYRLSSSSASVTCNQSQVWTMDEGQFNRFFAL